MRVDGFADGGTRISHHKRAKTAIMYITLHPRQKQKQNAIAHACGRIVDGGTHISNHNRALSCMSCLCRFSEKAIVCLSDIPGTLFITYSQTH